MQIYGLKNDFFFNFITKIIKNGTYVAVHATLKSPIGLLFDASVLLLAGKFLVYVPKLNSGSEYSEQLRSPHSKRYFSLLWGPHYFFRTPWYSSMVFVEMVVVVFEVSFC